MRNLTTRLYFKNNSVVLRLARHLCSSTPLVYLSVYGLRETYLCFRPRSELRKLGKAFTVPVFFQLTSSENPAALPYATLFQPKSLQLLSS